MKIRRLYIALLGILMSAQMTNAQRNMLIVNNDGNVIAISVSTVRYATFSASDKWIAVTNNGIEAVNDSTISASCTISPAEDAEIKTISITPEIGVCYSRFNAVPTLDDSCKVLGSAMGSYIFSISSLASGTTYYYRVYAKLANCVSYGKVIKATTLGTKPSDNSKTINGHKFVDLGLPSGLLWAETNIGAEAATDDGNYYAWGETDTKSTYSWNNYFDKNYTLYSYAGYASLNPNKKTDLDKEHDAAYVNWGIFCRMPTNDECCELLNSKYCTWTWTSIASSDGSTINGRKVTSVKNGNSIFLPASGYRSDEALNDYGSDGYYWSSTVKTSQSNNALYLSVYSSFQSTSDFVRYYGNTVRPVADPITISDSIDNAHWFYIKHHTDEKDLYWCKSTDDYSVTAAKPASSIDGTGFGDEYLWCIMGNATDGYKFYNKAAGSGYTLSRLDDETSVASLSAEATNNTFKMIRSQGDSVSGFAFYLDETTPYYLNAQDGSIKGSTTAGNSSTIRFNEPLEFTAERVLDWASGYQNYTTPDASSLPTGAVYTANVYLDNADSLTAYQTAYNNLSALVSEDRLNTLIDKNKKVAAGRSGVEEGTYYRLQCVEPKDKSSNGNYCFLSWDSNDQTGYPATVLEQTVKTSAASVWQFEKNGAYYRLKNLNTGKYLGSIKNTTSYRIPFTAADDEGLFTLSEYSGAAGHFKLLGKGTTQDYLFAENGTDDNHRLSVGNTEADGAAAWYIFKATELDVPLNTVGEASYASIYLPFAVTAPEGTKAYTGTLNEGNNSLKMEEQETVPAATGAILVGEQGANSATMTIVAKPSTTVDDNALLGTFTNKAVGASSVLTLGRNSENTSEIGLFTFTGTTIPANRAYLAMPSAGSISLYFFGDEVTGIESSTAERPDETPIYDLSGRRVVKATKGVYIKNGKKVFVK